MIVINAKVLTMDPANPRVEAVALDADKIVAVGTHLKKCWLDGILIEDAA
jgi:predicted amidohydrolase YtcJ